MDRARCRQGGALRRRPRRRRRAAVRPGRSATTRPTSRRCSTGPPSTASPGLVIDQPGSIAQLAIAVAARRGMPGGVRARPGDAPGGGPVPGRGEDRPARRVRDRRHRPDPPPPGPLARHRQRRAAGPAAGAQRVRHRPRRGPDPAHEPAPRRADQHLARRWSGRSGPGCTRPASGTCWPSSRRRPRCAPPGRTRISRDDHAPLAAAGRQGHRRRREAPWPRRPSPCPPRRPSAGSSPSSPTSWTGSAPAATPSRSEIEEVVPRPPFR